MCVICVRENRTLSSDFLPNFGFKIFVWFNRILKGKRIMPARRKTARRPMSAAAKRRMLARRRATMRANGTLARRAPARRRRRTSTALARPRRRKCPLNTAVRPDGSCSSRVPCMDDDGNVLPYATRGTDGNCRIKEAPRGYVINPETGKPVSIKTPAGKRLHLAKRADDAKEYLASYVSAAQNAQITGPLTYYDQFKPDRFLAARLRERQAARLDAINRTREAEAKREKEEREERENLALVSGMRRNLRRGYPLQGPIMPAQRTLPYINPRAGGASFNMNPASSFSTIHNG